MFKSDQKLFGNQEFHSRVKCLCMWYNLTEQLRCKIDILGLVLLGLGATRNAVPWPSWAHRGHSHLNNDSQSHYEPTPTTGELIQQVMRNELSGMDRN